MTFDPGQLDEIRSRLRVSDVVGSYFPLIKKGNEFVAKGNESFTVNDSKQFWVEFGSGGDGKPHDIFDFLQAHSGLSFPEAVEELARQAGVSLKNGSGGGFTSLNGSGNASTSNPRNHGSGEASSTTSRANRTHNGVAGAERSKREIVAIWPYFDAENNLLYETVRMQERLPDGSWRLKDGKPWKTFFQRRPSPDNDGTFVMGLDFIDPEGQPYQFIKSKNGGWLRATDERRAWWPDAEIKTFETAGNAEHWLYSANDVIDELVEPKDDQRTIMIPEGESKVDVLKEWGLLAVTNSGGAKNFTPACAEFFRNARHVVILQDNDRAGAERVAKIAPMLKEVGVDLVQALNFRDVWPSCPIKGDVKDWRDQGGGTKDQLLEIVDNLKPWTPEPYKSKFGAKDWRDLNAPVRSYPWRIKGVVPMSDNTLIMGPSRSGKTFEVMDMMMHCHFGKPFAGRRVEPGGFIYLTYEGATGFENRLRAYMKHHDIEQHELHSFKWLTRPPNLFATEDNVEALSVEILELAKQFQLPLAATIVDTHNSATRGSSEIKSDDLNKIMNNYAVINDRTGAPLWIVGHTNASGKHRGNEQFFNNIETALLIERVQLDPRSGNEKRDEEGHIIRRVKVNKQREGDDRISWEFVLRPIKIGIDKDGDDITSMVSCEPASNAPPELIREEYSPKDRPDGYYLRGNNVDMFAALLRALETHGKPPPASLGLPASIGNVIHWAQLGIEYKKIDPREQDEDIAKYSARIKARTRRFREDLMRYNVIGIAEMVDPDAVNEDNDKPKMLHFVWPTGRRVYGKGLQWPPLPKKKADVKPILAPGETVDGLSKDIF